MEQFTAVMYVQSPKEPYLALLFKEKLQCLCLSVCLEWMLAVQITPVFASIIEESWLTLVL